MAIVAKTVYIQQAEGDYWRRMSDSLHLEYRDLDAERGTIYSEDGSMLSTSIPYFDVRIDFMAEGLREKKGVRFKNNLDTLSIQLAEYFQDRSASAYARLLSSAYRRKERYFLLRRNISFEQYQAMRQFHLIRDGRNKSGFIFEDKEKRLTPFGLLANRTIGLSREYLDEKGRTIRKNVGLELTYDSLLRGEKGTRLVRRLAGGAFVPIEGSDVEPENGHDILTTLDVTIQDITENALLRVLTENECTWGTAIVMEVKTGEIKAIANLGRQPDGRYMEDMNYAITKSEPGSTFKLLTLLSVLEDNYTKPEDYVNLENGVWSVNGRTVYDSERHHRTDVTVKQAFELSSNVGMAKLAMMYYSRQPSKFIGHIRRLQLDMPTGMGIIGESNPVILDPRSRHWSAVTLPWMSFGYNLSITPMHTLLLYNAVANNGKMMRPRLVNAVMKDGKAVQTFKPEVRIESICRPETLGMLRESLEGVVLQGTAKSLVTPMYRFAGKTGTALVADGANGYKDKIYQSSFAGYFPAEDPKYTCVVVIRNKPEAKKFYGAAVAGPVFREIADKLFTLGGKSPVYVSPPVQLTDSGSIYGAGYRKDFEQVYGRLGIVFRDSSGKASWTKVTQESVKAVANSLPTKKYVMPDLKGMGLKDALYLIEQLQLKVSVRGVGKIQQQSLLAGQKIVKGQTVYLELN
jgi:cell division protein FtsI (penicillin-binding protein 3)